MKKKIISALLIILMTVEFFPALAIITYANSPDYSPARNRIQIYTQWNGDCYSYMFIDPSSGQPKGHLGGHGCGLFALCHMIQWLGYDEKDYEIAGYDNLPNRIEKELSKRTCDNMTPAVELLQKYYPNLEKYSSNTSLKTVLENGGAAILSFSNHYAVAVDISSDGKYVHVIDSCLTVIKKNGTPIYSYNTSNSNFEKTTPEKCSVVSNINWHCHTGSSHYNELFKSSKTTPCSNCGSMNGTSLGGGDYWIEYSKGNSWHSSNLMFKPNPTPISNTTPSPTGISFSTPYSSNIESTSVTLSIVCRGDPYEVGVDVDTVESNLPNAYKAHNSYSGNVCINDTISFTISGLNPSTKYYYRFYAKKKGCDNTYSITNSFSTIANTNVSFSDSKVNDIRENSAQPYVTVDYTGRNPSEFGIKYGTSRDNLCYSKKDTSGWTDDGHVDVYYNLSGLLSGTTYYYKFYAIQNGKTTETEVKSFTTKGPVHTPAPVTFGDIQVTNISSNSAVISFKYTAAPYEIGVDIGTSTSNVTYKTHKTVSGNQTDKYESFEISNLSPGTKYYYRLYAKQNGYEPKHEPEGSYKEFTTDIVEAPTVKVSLPYSHESIPDYPVTISWNSISGAKEYNYYISEFPSGLAYNEGCARSGKTASTSITISDLPSGHYTVFVQPVSYSGHVGPQSNWSSFDVREKDYVPTVTWIYNGHLYALYDYKTSWTHAKSLCVKLGGHLITISNNAENEALINNLAAAKGDRYWLGGYNYQPSDEYYNNNGFPYKWVTGEAFDFTNWCEGEPSGSGQYYAAEHFLEVRHSYDNKWNDTCNQNNNNDGFILEIDNIDSIEPKFTAKYQESEYRIYDVSMTWTEAETFCRSIGGHLAYVKSEEEQVFVAELTKHGERSWYHIGGSFVSDQGDAIWTDWTSINYDLIDMSGFCSGNYMFIYKSNGKLGWMQNAYIPSVDMSIIGFVCVIDHVHSYSALTTSATCTEKGYTTYTCTICGNSYVDDYVDALGHDFVSSGTVPPTETENGYTVYTCSRCSYSYISDYIDPLGHDYVAEIVEPTCTEKGYTRYTCTRCNDSFDTDFVDALGHDYNAVTVEATCIEGGYTTHTCSHCEDSYVDNYVNALGHDYAAEVFEPDCENYGYTVHTCSRCGDSNVDSIVDAQGHDYHSEIVSPTCTEEGYILYTCSRCGDSFEDEYVEPLGHDYVITEQVKPTAAEDGYIKYVCNHDPSHTYTEILYFDNLPKIKSVTTSREAMLAGYYGTRFTFNAVNADLYVFTIYSVTDSGELTSISSSRSTTNWIWLADSTFQVDKCLLVLDVFNDYGTDEMGVSYSFANGIITDTHKNHVYDDTIVSASCTVSGYTLHSCTECAYSYCSDYTEHTEHVFSSNYTIDFQPTVDTVGLRSRHCIDCGYTTDVEEIQYQLGDATGDNRVNTRDLVLMKKYIAGSIGDDDAVLINADLNEDGRINSRDIALIKRIFVS